MMNQIDNTVTYSRQINQIILLLRQTYPEADCTLEFDSPWELLVGGILGAQCTDERVNLIAPLLHERFPQLSDYVFASLSEIEQIIRSCGLYRNKAKAIKGSAVMILTDFAGQVPEEESDLLRLPGVGRKIANLVRSDFFGHPAIVVDTHCGRISRLLGLTDSKDPVRIERDLQQILPQTEWISWGHLMVAHGRNLCEARCRQCRICPLRPVCAYGLAIDFSRQGVRGNDGRECY